MKSPVVWATILFVVLMTALAFLMGPEDHASSRAYGPNVGAPHNSAPVQ